MNSTNRFDWVDFYKELAGKLLQYKRNRQKLVAKVREIYKLTGLDLPMLERRNKIVDIDPFTFFGLFNKNSMKEVNRGKIISAIAELLGVVTPVPTSYDSIPFLNNRNAVFYSFIGDREDSDIDDLWNLFESALAYADSPTLKNRLKLSKYFDLTINKKGNGNSKITMGMYWIDPDSFLNLDQRNTWYIYESGKIPVDLVQTLPDIETKISFSKYFDIVEKLRIYLQSEESTIKDFKELSFEAWCYSEEVNKEYRDKEAQAQRETKGAAVADEDVEITHYWIYSPGDGAASWDEFYETGIMGIGWDSIGDLKAFGSKDEMKQKMKETFDSTKSYKNAAYATWQFANDMKPGDIVFAKKGMHLIVGRGIVESDYEYDISRTHYRNVRKVKWTHKGEWQHPGHAVMKTLTDITSYTEYVEKLNALFESDIIDDMEEQEIEYPDYDAEKFLEEVYMDKRNYDALVAL
ncbi:MAG: GTPase, partial [Lachnospiraceae bacterium]|nr:GTPase [Lachnospiraceae bacterium]